MKIKYLFKDALLSFGLPIKTSLIIIGNLIVLIVAVQFSFYSLKNYNETDEMLGQQYYKVFDNFENTSVTESSDFLIKLKTLHKKLYETSDFLFLDISNQPLLIEEKFKTEDYFISGYENNSMLTNVEDLETGFVYNGYNSIQIDYRALEQFGLEKSIPEDVKWCANFSSNTEIPVILGYDFSELGNLQENSVYNSEYLFVPIKIKVVGYLPKDSFYYNGSDMVNLDRTVLLPAIEYSGTAKTQEEWDAQRRIYLEKVSGIVATKDNRAIAQSKLSGICAEVMLPTLSIQGTLSGESVFKMQASEFAKVLILLSMVLSLFASIGLIISLIEDVTKNYTKFGIHLLSGAIVSDLYKICFVRYLFVSVISVLCALFISNFIIPLERTVVIVFLFFGLIFCALFMILPLNKIRKSNLCSLLRRYEE